MCGICGTVNPDGVVIEQLERMIDTLSHRGPDDKGLYVDGAVGLGHRRLSIIDLDRGHQPMTNEDGSLWIVFNGEIYNYRDLRKRLRETHRFMTDSDTEVILHLYEEQRERCVEALRGMFAFAIWDAKRHSLFLARDHLGQKPLFYVHRGEEFAFASEIKGLLAVDPGLRRMDHQALDQYLTLRVILPPRTMFAEVRKLPPGSTLLFENGRAKVERYWHLRYQPKLRLSEDDALDELEHRVLETVRYHMVSDVPVGAFLSGGLDSSLVVAMMSKVASEPIKTFSVGVPYKRYSELPFARIAAQTFRTQHFEQKISPSLTRILPELAWHLDEPSDPLSACMYYLATLARREVKVVLGGDGGDELFGGYDRYYGLGYAAYYARLPHALRKDLLAHLWRLIPDGFWYKSLSHQLKWLNYVSLAEGGRRYARSLGYFYFGEDFRTLLYTSVLRRELGGFDPEAMIAVQFDAANATDLVDKMLFTDTMSRLPEHSVTILDRMTMAHGLEARSPFLDHELAEFAASLPSSWKIRGHHTRYIQTRLAERYLPRPLRERPKQGFSSALPYILDGEFRRLYTILLSDSHLVADGYFNPEPIRRLLAEHLERRVDHGNRLWLLCNAELWYRMSIKQWSKERVGAEVTGTGQSC
jgi:asparagine synthase (glutamine-hydrolysing)